MIKLMYNFLELKQSLLTNGELNSTKVNGNFDNLHQLILLEDFKNCTSSDIRSHIHEQNAPTLDAAACIADEYALTHKKNFSDKSKQSFSKDNVNSKSANKNKNYERQV